MKTVIFAILIMATMLAVSSAALATVKPNALFSDGAVLQRGIDLPVWGTANDGEKVTVKFQKQEVSTTVQAGRWMVRLNPLKAGGPFTMTVSGENTIELKNVLVGEVWVCSGQSNMQWPLAQTTGADQVIASSKDSLMRLFTVPNVPKDFPVHDVNASWQECGPDTVPGFSAVAYYFGRDLRRSLKVPIGLINTSWGGTLSQAWTSRGALMADPQSAGEIKNPPGWSVGPNVPTVLYNGMIAPLLPYGIRGAIWYQGESNAGDAYRYGKILLPMMIQDWREHWGLGDFPFLVVQLAPFQKINPEPEDSAWAELREAQLLTSLNVPNTGMAVITDYGNPDNIHPPQKEPVGGRLALAAGAIAYQQSVVYQGPMYKSIKIDGDKAILSFSNAKDGLVIKNPIWESTIGVLKGFTIAGEDQKFHNAKAEIKGRNIIVSSPDVQHPVAVRFGWSNCPVVNLFNNAGLPASPFRTDGFRLTTQPR